MNPRLTLSITAAIIAGVAAGTQAMFAGRIGVGIGPVRTSLLINAAGGTIGIVIVLCLLALERSGVLAPVFAPAVAQGRMPFSLVVLSGFLGLVIVGGISLGVQGAGVAAALSILVLAQLVTGMILDATGLNATVVVPIDFRRVVGVLVVVVGVYLMLPRSQ